MLFNSIEYLIFFPLVFGLYWGLLGKRLVAQNTLILISSYVFYGWWDWRFLSLIIVSSLGDFLFAQRIESSQNERGRKLWLTASIVLNLGFLGYFKYANFFIAEFQALFASIGYHQEISSLNLILPVGISFYTFQTLSYTIDVYRKQMKATRDVLSFFTYVSFFPQLVAGPIERATNLLPQFIRQRSFDVELAKSGLRLILWGLVKKVVVADTCAGHVNFIFEHHEELNGSLLLLGGFYFAFQIYGDFSGYSDIAIGSARLLGFNLMRNFAYPYFSRDIAEFWRRWHISLSTWFRDYLYIPLGGSRAGKWFSLRNIFIIFIVSGFWHGANWTFIVWGLLNAAYYVPLFILNQNRKNIEIIGHDGYQWRQFLGLGITFLLTIFAWIMFRSDDVHSAMQYYSGVFSTSILSSPGHPQLDLQPLAITSLFLLFEWIGKRYENPLEVTMCLPRWIRWGGYYILLLLVLNYSHEKVDFIYFQF